MSLPVKACSKAETSGVGKAIVAVAWAGVTCAGVTCAGTEATCG